MPTAHLLFGFLGSGKTTLARDLEQRHRAVRFTPDVWMARLFGEDPPADSLSERRLACPPHRVIPGPRSRARDPEPLIMADESRAFRLVLSI
ncbi:hypothetical protein FF100_02150 [Methylobacterium terricola]|uniref:AAA domain-containing protein n=1 Tax=Methylobacterium terricola TaxID=2583531 RepID=A0A5C4LMZ5_9HYPH|nr:AAA family ATPase [Methylobacterium terricola]TNC16089.1 hypothetical protein FF100_02150 [Methylobacterium terricola]